MKSSVGSQFACRNEAYARKFHMGVIAMSRILVIGSDEYRWDLQGIHENGYGMKIQIACLCWFFRWNGDRILLGMVLVELDLDLYA